MKKRSLYHLLLSEDLLSQLDLIPLRAHLLLETVVRERGRTVATRK